ncbi:MAG: hypothetical protein DMG94_07840 [Acidobacteria bacterium]|nr:MAG: hypothetical protein DMG94_07840 [Acidobacteriota bacterium]
MRNRPASNQVSFQPAFGTRGVMVLGLAFTQLFMLACSGGPKEEAPVVPVQLVQVQKAALQQKVVADAVLFPIAQSAIVPKISAPVEKFLVNRGSHVRAGQLLAVLDVRSGPGAVCHHHNRGLAAGNSEGATRSTGRQTATRCPTKSI